MFKVIGGAIAILTAVGYMSSQREFRSSESHSVGSFILDVALCSFWTLSIFMLSMVIGTAIDTPQVWATELSDTHQVERVVYDGSSYHLIEVNGGEMVVRKSELVLEEGNGETVPFECEHYTGFSENLYNDVDIYKLYKPDGIAIEFIDDYTHEIPEEGEE